MVKRLGRFVHIVLSPRDCPKHEPLETYLKSHCENYVISQEHGDTGHLHLECFAEFHTEHRIDHVRRAVLNLYPDIPKEETRNVKVTMNYVDPDPQYGYGYALKEGMPLVCTLDEFEQADCLDYYNRHEEKVKQSIAKISENHKYDTLDQIAMSFVGYATESGLSHQQITDPILFKNQVLTYLHSVKDRIRFSVFSKINIDKLQDFVKVHLGTSFLTVPLTETQCSMFLR